MDTLDKNELSGLIIESLEGIITSERLGRLDQLLSQYPEAVNYYMRHLRIYSLIAGREVILFGQDEINKADITQLEAWEALAEYEKIAPAVKISQEKRHAELIQKVIYPPREKQKISKFQIVTLIASVAAILFIIVFPKIVDTESIRVEVATLVDEINVQWADSSAPVKNGNRLWTHNGPLQLNKGIVKLQYDDGVEVLVEGPAVFEVERSGIYLEYGHLYSRVYETGLGFRVKTPTSLFLDQGTEFGVEADINGATELHVIKGKVQLFAGYEKQSKLSQLVTTDTAVSYNAKAHKISSIPFEKHHFVSQINSRTKSVLRGYANRYQAAVAETRPVAWYRFEKGQDALGYDEISGTATSCDYSEPVTLAEGMAIESEPANQSLYLAEDAQSGIFLSDKVVQRTGGRALSISLWIRPEQGINDSQNIICYTDNNKNVAVFQNNRLVLLNDGRVEFYIYDIYRTTNSTPLKETEKDANGLIKKGGRYRLMSREPLPLDLWSHITACYSDKKMELYINGQLCASKEVPIRTEYHQGGYWGVGCMIGQSAVGRYSNYKGDIDEVSFYDRPLTAQEVQSLYEAAIPLR